MSCIIIGEERIRGGSPESLQKIPELVTSLNFQIASAHTSIQHWYSQNYDLAIS